MTKITKNISKSSEKNWKDPWHQPCRARAWFIQAPRKWLQCRKLHLKKIHRRFMVVQRKLMNSQGQRVKTSVPTKHEDRIAGKGFTSMTHYNFCSQIYSYASSTEDSGFKKLQWIKNGTSSTRSYHFNWRKVKSKKEVILEAQRDKRKVHFASLIDICHLKNAELETELPKKYKGPCLCKKYKGLSRASVVTFLNHDSGGLCSFDCVPND